MEYTPKDELYQRIRKFQDLLRERNLDGALISQNMDLFYFTGTTQRGYLFIPSEGEPLLMVQRCYERARQDSALKNIIFTEGFSSLPDLLKEAGYERPCQIGLEMDVLPARLFFRTKETFSSSTFVDISGEIKKVRSRKSPYEVKQIRRSARILDIVMQEAKQLIREGTTEIELEGILWTIGRREGHQGILRMRGFNMEMMTLTIYSGPNGAVPSYPDTPLGGPGTNPAVAYGGGERTIERNEPIVFDHGVGINGYTADQTRVFVIGDLSKKLREAYEVMRNIKLDMELNTSPGQRCLDIYNRAFSIAKKAGYEDSFQGYRPYQVSFIGHGLGLEINELPFLSEGNQMVLEEDMVFAFEPKVVFPGEGAVGVEDDYLVTSQGVERLTITEDTIIRV